MSTIAERIKSEAASLSQKERADLAQFFLRSLDESDDEEHDQEAADIELEEELIRREKAYLSGKTKAYPVEEVLEELRKKLQ